MKRAIFLDSFGPARKRFEEYMGGVFVGKEQDEGFSTNVKDYEGGFLDRGRYSFLTGVFSAQGNMLGLHVYISSKNWKIIREAKGRMPAIKKRATIPEEEREEIRELLNQYSGECRIPIQLRVNFN